jgi:formylglycine-generating enzyme required for sulfatase activity
MDHLARLAAAALAVVAGSLVPALAQQCCTGNVSTYCTAGTSVQGCVPQISGVGVPSMNATSGFDIAIPNMPGQRFGSIFYGFYELVTPWAPGSPSFRCVANPVQRTGNLFSGGTLGLCDGELRLDFNAWRAANPGALGSPFAVGQTIRAQGWYRDPAAPSQTNLSDALVFSLCSGSGDIVPPMITTCAANQTVGTVVSCNGLVPDFTASVVASDNCPQVTLTQSPTAGTSAALGTTAVTITARDAAGNTSQCGATLTVLDTTGPTITSCAANQTVVANGNCQGVVPDFTQGVVASDACGGAVTISQLPAAGSLTGTFAISTVTITATDVAGNSSTCAATLTVTPLGACAIPPGFVAIQSGTFLMGSNAANAAPYFNDSAQQPVHPVTLSYSFWMGATEVTQAQYGALMGTNPSSFFGDNNPVERVSWFDAQAYCDALTTQQAALGNVPPGYQYRLPTEAEWEYACRAGTTTEFNVGNALFCNQAKFGYSYHSNSGCNSITTVPVASYAPNAWGLHDMHGNVSEWCLDSYAAYSAGAVTDPFVTGGPNRVIRGGSWFYVSQFGRSAYRNRDDPGVAVFYIGFRVVLAPILVP